MHDRGRAVREHVIAYQMPREAGTETDPVGMSPIGEMAKGFTEIGNLAKSGKAAAEHATDFDPTRHQRKLSLSSTTESWPRE
jgi:hypothetical protein